MGLDMYLIKKTSVKNYSFTPEDQKADLKITLEKTGEPYPGVDIERVTCIEEEVGYWRKANQIHNWFVENVQDGIDNCQLSYVPIEQLEQLLELCKQVKENPKDAEGLLPTQGGFFFGSTEYDEFYLNDIEDTIKILERVISEAKENEKKKIYSDYYYQSSW